MLPATLDSINAIPYLNTLGIHIDQIGPTSAVMHVRIDERHLNYFGGAHGGLIASLADTVCFFPQPLLPSGLKVTTANLNVNYLHSVKIGELITASSEILHLGRRTVSLSVTIRNEDRVIAHGTATLIVLGADQSNDA